MSFLDCQLIAKTILRDHNHDPSFSELEGDVSASVEEDMPILMRLFLFTVEKS